MKLKLIMFEGVIGAASNFRPLMSEIYLSTCSIFYTLIHQKIVLLNLFVKSVCTSVHQIQHAKCLFTLLFGLFVTAACTSAMGYIVGQLWALTSP